MAHRARHRPGAARGACWPARTPAARAPSRPAAVEAALRGVRGVAVSGERAARSRSSSSATARDITGGSESLARAVAERLAADVPTSRSSPPARATTSPGATSCPRARSASTACDVRRFPVEEERDLAAFNRFAEPLYGARRTTRRRRARLAAPPGPLRAAAGARRSRSASRTASTPVVFFTYLYYPTYWGLRAAPERAVLVPTTHDEPPLRFSHLPRGVRAAAGVRVPDPAGGGAGAAALRVAGRPARGRGHGGRRAGRRRTRRPSARGTRCAAPYALYAGRIDAGKGCAEMLASLRRATAARRGAARPGADRPPGDAGAAAVAGRPLPGLPVRGREAAALAGARVVVCPSPFESLSIVLLEGLALGTPGLVNARSRGPEGALPALGRRRCTTRTPTSSRRRWTSGRPRRLAARGARRERPPLRQAEYRWDVVLDR